MTSARELLAQLFEARVLPRRSRMPFDSVEKEAPLRDTETIRVYHGFHDLSWAIHACTHGLTGKERADRRYSYEFNNNPKGLYVTAEIDVAKEFLGYHGAVIEFNARMTELEAAVWPGGNYTVQGQMAQSFDSDEDREKARLRDREGVKAAPHMQTMTAITLADRPELASQLLFSREMQALFIGDLNPEGVRAVWVPVEANKAKPNLRRLSRQQFLKEFANKGFTYNDRRQTPDRAIDQEHRVFKPREPFNMEQFIDRLAKEYPKQGRQWVIDALPIFLEDNGALDSYLWPNQREAARAAIEAYLRVETPSDTPPPSSPPA